MRNLPVIARFVLFCLSSAAMKSESPSFHRYHRVNILRLRAGTNERTMSTEPASQSGISSNANATFDIARLIRERDEALNRERLALEKVEQATKIVADFARNQATRKRAYQRQYDEDQREREKGKEAENCIPTKDGANVTTSTSMSDINQQERVSEWDKLERSPRDSQEANQNENDEEPTDELVSFDPNDSFDDDDDDSSMGMPDDHPDNCKPRTDPLVRAESIRDAMSMTLDEYIEKRRRRGDPYYAYEPR